MADPIDDGGPAFPCDQIELGDRTVRSEGMSLRDYFAAKALPTVAALMAAGLHQPGPDEPRGAEFIARSAYRLADEMLKARQS